MTIHLGGFDAMGNANVTGQVVANGLAQANGQADVHVEGHEE